LRFPFRRIPPGAPAAEPAALPGRFVFESASRTHVGTIRSLNEDRILVLDDAGLWVVADGMGGHRNGDFAAQAIIDEIARSQPQSATLLEAAAQRANQSIRNKVGGDDIAGSTLAALSVRDRTFECHWAGDSQIWLHRAGELRKLTRDHSLVQQLVDAGAVSEAEREKHPQSHVITRAIGVSKDVQVETNQGAAATDDLFLLCSDGLTGALGRDEISRTLATGSLESMADHLLGLSLANRASDNVSFILVRLHDPV